jgi:hypothetical protein
LALKIQCRDPAIGEGLPELRIARLDWAGVMLQRLRGRILRASTHDRMTSLRRCR